jgi:hypothetical protein
MGMQWLLFALMGSGFFAWLISFMVIFGWAAIVNAAQGFTAAI